MRVRQAGFECARGTMCERAMGSLRQHHKICTCSRGVDLTGAGECVRVRPGSVRRHQTRCK